MKTWEHRYETAHPDSGWGNPNKAWESGLRLIAIKPNGILVYRRKRWWEFWL